MRTHNVLRRRAALGLTQRQVRQVHPAAVGAIAGVGSATVAGLITYFGAKLAARMAGPLAVANGVLVGGAVGYLAGSYWAERQR